MSLPCLVDNILKLKVLASCKAMPHCGLTEAGSPRYPSSVSSLFITMFDMYDTPDKLASVLNKVESSRFIQSSCVKKIDLQNDPIKFRLLNRVRLHDCKPGNIK